MRTLRMIKPTLTIAAVAAWLASGCGSVRTFDENSSHRLGEFQVLDTTFEAGGSAQSVTLAIEDSRDQVAVSVMVQGAKNLKSLYFTLDYDPKQLSPISVEPTDALSGDHPGDLLHISSFLEAGVVADAQSLARPAEKAGFSGDGVLAVMMFSRQACSAGTRSSSKAPRNISPVTQYISEAGVLQVYQYCRGDYDQNGEVNISDLAPLAAHLGESAPLIDPISSLPIIDGDGNGEININDLTSIAANLGTRLEGYKLYRSDSIADYPTDLNWTDPNGPGATLVTTLAVGGVLMPGFRNRYDAFLPGAGVYWFRPYDGDDLGRCSMYTEVAAP